MPRPSLEVADIFRVHGPAWRLGRQGHLSLSQLKVMSAIEQCRSAALGGHVLCCSACGQTEIAYNSWNVDPEDDWGKLVLMIRKHYATHGIPAVLKTARGEEPLRRLVDTIRETQRQYQEHWWSKLLPGIRVFCVSEVRDSLLMWAHYAQDHTGAVFEFWSLPEADNPLAVAAPVQYAPSPPSFFSEQEFIDDLLSLKRLDFQSLYRRYAYIKSDHWDYEKEWRVWYPFSHTDTHDLNPINPAELRAAYFGCRMDPDTRRRLTTLLRTGFPDVKLYQARRRNESYALEFTEA